MSFKKRKYIALGMASYLTMSSIMAADYDNHWAKTAIDKWQAYGIVKGYEDNTFRPNQSITRAEFAAILSRVLNLSKAEGVPSFIDIMMNLDKWYAEDVQKVTALDLMYIEGMDFMPNQAITREEAAYAIAKAYELSSPSEEIVSFTDKDLISNWAIQSIQVLTQYNYLKGNPDGSFKPQGTLTRAELVTMLNNLTEHLIKEPGIYTESMSGNVLIQTKGVTLKNMTINGDLYLAQGIGREAVTLDNVTVKGSVYVNGGTVTMSGTFEEVKLASGLPMRLVKGNIKKLVVNKEGSTFTVDKEGAVKELIENKLVDLLGEGKIQGAPIISTVPGGGVSGNGGAGGNLAGQVQGINITSAGLYINDNYVSLPVVDNVITLDISALGQDFESTDEVTGIVIEASEGDAVLSSQWGSMASGEKYTFKETEEALGIIREIALKAGISPTIVINYVFGGEQLTIGSLLEDFKTAIQNAAAMDIKVESQYEFVRTIQHSDGRSSTFTIEMRIQ